MWVMIRLNDGEYFYSEGHANQLIVDLAQNPQSFGEAIKMLRTQTLPGGKVANNKARHFVVSASIEFLATKMLYESGNRDIALYVLPGLPDGRWYLLADPQLSPSIARLQLRGQTRQVLLEQNSNRIEYDGTLAKCRIDTGAALLSRVGIVKGGL